MEENSVSRQDDGVRRWQSMNEKNEVKPSLLPRGSASSRQNLSANTTIRIGSLDARSVAVGGSGSRHSQGPVVYVLPDQKKKSKVGTSTTSRTTNSLAGAPYRQMKEHSKLKYPHGMPRWGPRLVTSNKAYSFDNEYKDAMEDLDIKKFEVPESKSSNMLDSDLPNRGTPANSRQEVIVKKAREQSQMAAARAAQNIAATNSLNASPLLNFSKNNTPKGNHRPKQSLLQSARVQQSKVLHASDRIVGKAVSLDDSFGRSEAAAAVRAAEGSMGGSKRVARSVQSFAYLRHPQRSSTSSCQQGTKEEEGSVENPESWTNVGKRVANQSSDDQDGADDEEEEVDGNSWEMQSTSSGAKSNDVNSADHHEIIDGGNDDGNSRSSSSHLSQETSEESTESDSVPRHFYGMERSSIPTLIHSEFDAENSSLYSDFSSLAVNTRGGSFQDDDDDNLSFYSIRNRYYDSAASLRTATPASLDRKRRFDARRCQELLNRRNNYLQEDARKRLISPQAVQRLKSTPALSKLADGTALQELASRGRWHLDRQHHEYKVSIPHALSQPLASMPNNDEEFDIKPISLVAPTMITSLANSNKYTWHKPQEAEDDTSSDSSVEECEKRTLSICKRFFVRCAPVLVLSLWVSRAYNLFHDIPCVEATTLGITAQVGATSEVDTMTILNLSMYSSHPGTTNGALPYLPHQPPKLLESTDLSSQAGKYAPKCYAEKQQFWEIDANKPMAPSLEEIDTAEYSVIEALESTASRSWAKDPLFFFDMSSNLSICDDFSGTCYLASPVIIESEAAIHEHKSEATIHRREQGQDVQIQQENETLDNKTTVNLPSNRNAQLLDGHKLANFAAVLHRKSVSIKSVHGKRVLATIAAALRKSAQNLENIDHLYDGNNTFFHKLVDVLQKSSSKLPRVDAFNDIDEPDNNLLQAFVEVLRKPSQSLQEKRRRRRKIYRV